MNFSHLIEKLKSRAGKIAHSRKAIFIMSLICFLEPIFLPMIPELIIAPVMLARKKEKLKIIIIAIASALLGALVAYSLGAFLGQVFITSLLGESGTELYSAGLGYIHKYGALLPFIGSFLPFPLKIISWICGLTHFKLWVLLGGIFLGRSLRYSAMLLIPQQNPKIAPNRGVAEQPV